MSEVYVVTSGEYSDYHIEAVFADYALAQRYVTWCNERRYSDKASIEAWALDDVPVLMRKGQHGYRVKMLRNGDSEVEVTGDTEPFPMQSHIYTDRFAKPDDPWRLYLDVRVVAVSAEAAVKIANELRGQLIARGAWPEAADE
jgi:hypothetical protein